MLHRYAVAALAYLAALSTVSAFTQNGTFFSRILDFVGCQACPCSRFSSASIDATSSFHLQLKSRCVHIVRRVFLGSTGDP